MLSRMREVLRAPTDEVLASMLSVNVGTFKVWRNRKSIPQNYFALVAEISGSPVYWLKLGTSQKPSGLRAETIWDDPDELKAHATHEPNPKIPPPDGFILVPRYDVTGSMGNGHVIQSEQIVDHLAFRAEWVRTELGTSPTNLVLISAVGDSMEPTLRAHDLLLIDRSVLSVKQDSIYAFAVDGELRVKRIQRLFDGSLIIKSDNPEYTTETLTAQQAETINIIGRVVWSGRRM